VEVTNLGSAGDSAAFDTLVKAYHMVEEVWFDDLIRGDIVEELSNFNFHDERIRDVAARHATFFKSIIVDCAEGWPESVTNAIRVLKNTIVTDEETIQKISAVLTQKIHLQPDRWKWTRQQAADALEMLCPRLIEENLEVAECFFEVQFDENDPRWFCAVCRWRFQRPKEPGFICDCCGAEVGVDDDHNYLQSWMKNGARWFRPDEKPADWDIRKQLSG